MSVLLVTGTDTGVGKTWVTCALAHALVAAGQRVAAIKPVETGCGDAAGHAEDGALLAAATGQRSPRQALRRFAAPLAPAMAADDEGVPLELGPLVREIERHAAGMDVLLVEGAGGLLAPISWNWSAIELARALNAAVLVVASDRLGAINHTLLTLQALAQAGLDVRGVALIPPARPDRSTGRNAAAISRLSGLERVTALPRVADPRAAGPSLAAVAGWVRNPGPAPALRPGPARRP